MNGFSTLLEYREVLLKGAWVTLELSIFGLLVSLAFGLLACLGKMSKNPWLRVPAYTYTTLVRGELNGTIDWRPPPREDTPQGAPTDRAGRSGRGSRSEGGGGRCPCTQKGFEYCTPKMKTKIRMGSVIPVPYANDGMLSHRF